MIQKNIKKVSIKLLEMTTEISLNLEELLKESPEGKDEENGKILQEWFDKFLAFSNTIKKHVRRGIMLLARDILMAGDFKPKRVTIKKKSELDSAIEQIKKLLIDEEGLLSNNLKEKLKQKQKKKKFNVNFFKANIFPIGNCRPFKDRGHNCSLFG